MMIARPSLRPGPARCIALCVALASAVVVQAARAQLTPDRLYFGFDQRITVTVSAPPEYAGDLRIRLYDPRSGEVVSESSAALGRVDLAGLFPRLWQTPEPRVLYAQLMVGSEPVGAALVLDPRRTPDAARLVDPVTLRPTEDPAQGRPMFSRAATGSGGGGTAAVQAPAYAAMRVYPERLVVLHSSEGPLTFRMRPDHAPNTVFNFLHLVEGGFYTAVPFHRIVNRLADGSRFVVQAGDPTGNGDGGPGYAIDLEPSTLHHAYGVLSMARSADPNSAGSQVFICLGRTGTAGLDGLYTSFGELVDGSPALEAIAATPTGERDRPLEPPVIERAELIEAPPFPRRPRPAIEPVAPETGR